MQTHLTCIRDRGDLPASVVQLREHFGGIPFERISFRPEPGTATEEDLCKWKLCELVDGTIVIRELSMLKSALNADLLFALANWLGDRDGYVFPSVGLWVSDSVIWLLEIMYFSAETWGGRPLDDDLVSFAADLVVDFKTDQSTEHEMQRRRDEHRAIGTRLIWSVDIAERGVYEVDRTSGDERIRWIGANDCLCHDIVLPGFRFPVLDWFQGAESHFRSDGPKGRAP